MRRLVLLVSILLAWAPAARAWTWPVSGPVLQPFSFDRSHPYEADRHRGVDLGAAAGARVLAPAGGTVGFAGSVPTSGRTVTIDTPGGLAVTLTHLGSIAVAVGSSVREGDVIGTIGPSGTPEVASPYVHLGIRELADDNGYVDPLGLLLPARPDGGAPAGAAAPVGQAPAAAAPAPPAVAPSPATPATPAPAAPVSPASEGRPASGTAPAGARAAPVAAAGNDAERERPQVEDGAAPFVVGAAPGTVAAAQPQVEAPVAPPAVRSLPPAAGARPRPASHDRQRRERPRPGVRSAVPRPLRVAAGPRRDAPAWPSATPVARPAGEARPPLLLVAAALAGAACLGACAALLLAGIRLRRRAPAPAPLPVAAVVPLRLVVPEQEDDRARLAA